MGGTGGFVVFLFFIFLFISWGWALYWGVLIVVLQLFCCCCLVLLFRLLELRLWTSSPGFTSWDAIPEFLYSTTALDCLLPFSSFSLYFLLFSFPSQPFLLHYPSPSRHSLHQLHIICPRFGFRNQSRARADLTP